MNSNHTPEHTPNPNPNPNISTLTHFQVYKSFYHTRCNAHRVTPWDTRTQIRIRLFSRLYIRVLLTLDVRETPPLGLRFH